MDSLVIIRIIHIMLLIIIVKSLICFLLFIDCEPGAEYVVAIIKKMFFTDEKMIFWVLVSLDY
jgi:hypothetical protein